MSGISPKIKSTNRIAVPLLAVSLAISSAAGSLLHASTLSSEPAMMNSTTHESVVTGNRVRLIVKTTGTLTDAQKSTLTKLGCDVYRNLPIIGSVALSAPMSNVDKLSALPFVVHVSEDAVAHKTDAFTVGSSVAGPAFTQLGLTGYGIGIAVIDSGITAVPDNQQVPAGIKLSPGISSNRIVASMSFIQNTSAPAPGPAPAPAPGASSTNDQCGHGTHVAGIIAGDGTSSYGPGYSQTFFGIARFTNLVNLRVLDQNGAGSVSNVVAAIQWAVTNKAKYNIRIINLSLGQPVTQSYTTDPLCQACEAAWNQGLFVVCAAGNAGRLNSTSTAGAPNEGWGTAYGSIESPGNDPLVLTVGATKSIDGIRADDRIATYSSRGPTVGDCVIKPDLVAPGNEVISDLSPGCTLQTLYASTNSVPMSTYQSNANPHAVSTNYFILSGTSMSAPVISGAAALLLQANPNLTPDTLKARLMTSCDPITFADGTTDVCTFGAGYVDILSALASTVVATQPARSPSVYVDSTGVVRVKMDNALWGSGATQNPDGSWTIAANATIWGTGLTQVVNLYGQNALWGSTSGVGSSNALWGSTALSSTNALWGSQALWGSNALWGDGPSNSPDTDSATVDLSSCAIDGDLSPMFNDKGHVMRVHLRFHSELPRNPHHIQWGN